MGEGKNIAEVGEDLSEAWGGSERNTTLMPLVNSKSETTDRRRRGASAVSVVRFGKKASSHIAEWVEISGASGGALHFA